MDHNLVTNWKLRRRRRKIKRVIRISLFILIVIGILVIFNQFSLKKNDSVGLVTSAIKGVQSVQTEDDSLKLVVENALEETKGTYGIVIKNLKTGEQNSK